MTIEEILITSIIMLIILTIVLSIVLAMIELRKSKVQGGGLIIIGPVVIPFGQFTKYKKELVILSIILLILFIAMFLKFLI